MTTQPNPLARYVGDQLSAIRAHTGSARAGDRDAVHDARVAVRRLRCTFKTFRPLFAGDVADRANADLQWVGAALGRVRDAQVLSHCLVVAVEAEPPELIVGPVTARVRSSGAAETGQALDGLAGALDDPRFAALLVAMDRLVETELAEDREPSTLLRLIRKAVRRADRRLAAADAADEADRDRVLHTARRAYKRARYAVEPLRATTGDPAARLARRLAAVQDLLGTHHDTVVGRERLRSLGMQAQLDGENAFTYGLLYARQGEAARQVLASLPAVARKANRRGVRTWLAP